MVEEKSDSYQLREYTADVRKERSSWTGRFSVKEFAVQETFIKYLQKAPRFRDEEHRKAWLLTVATNQCIREREKN